jgi:hypothetical protein
MTTLSTVQERFCIASGEKDKIELSAQDLVSCDKANWGCNGGFVNRALEYGKRVGYIEEHCQMWEGDKAECEVENVCR